MAQELQLAHYSGRSRTKFDGSFRLLLQKDWRTEGGPSEFMVIPWPLEKEPRDYLMVLPFDRYLNICRHLQEHSVFTEDMTAFKRVIGSCSKKVEFDKFGRIALSQSLLEEVGIQDEAELVGAVDHIEIWNPARYEATLVENRRAVPQVRDRLSL